MAINTTKKGERHFLPTDKSGGFCSVDWSRVTLYVCRLRNDRPYGMARPCPACMAAIQSLGIKHIVYTTNDGFAVENLMKAS